MVNDYNGTHRAEVVWCLMVMMQHMAAIQSHFLFLSFSARRTCNKIQ